MSRRQLLARWRKPKPCGCDPGSYMGLHALTCPLRRPDSEGIPGACLRTWGQHEVAPADVTKAEFDLHLLIWGDVYITQPAGASPTADNETGPAAAQTAGKDPSNKAEGEKQ